LYTDEQRARQPRSAGDGNAVDRIEADFGLSERQAEHMPHVSEVVAGSELRHDAAVGRMQLDLALHGIAQHLAVAPHDRSRRFVAGGFDAEHEHEKGARRVPGFSR